MILRLPEPTRAIQNPVRPRRGERFPRMDNPIERMLRPTFNQHMDMVWHDAPTQQLIPLRIEEKKRILHLFSDPRIPQMTLTCAAVEHGGNPLLLLGLPC